MIEGTKIGSAVVTFTIEFTPDDIWNFFRRPISEVSDRELLDIIRSHPAMTSDAPVTIDRDE